MPYLIVAKHIVVAGNPDLFTRTEGGRAALKYEVVQLLNLTPALSEHLHYHTLLHFVQQDDLDEYRALCVWMLATSLRVTRHEAAHAVALILLHEPYLYTLRHVDFIFAEPVIEIEVNGSPEEIKMLMRGGVHITLGSGAEVLQAGITTMHAPDYLEPPTRLYVEGEEYRYGGMGDSDNTQEARFRKNLMEHGISPNESMAAVRRSITENIDLLNSATNVLSAYFYTGVMNGQMTFSAEEVKRALSESGHVYRQDIG